MSKIPSVFLIMVVAASLVFSGLSFTGSCKAAQEGAPSKTVASKTAAPSDDLCAGVDMNFINTHSPYLFQEILEKHPLKDQDMCLIISQIQGQYVPIYVPATKNAVIFGDMLVNKQSPARNIIADIQAQDFTKYKADLDKAVAFTLKPEGATKYIYEFTDPMCPYCQNAKKPLKDWAEQNKVEVKVVLFPLSIHPGSKEKAIAGICAGMSFDDYLADKYTGIQCKQGEDKVNASLSLATKVGVNGTPTLISPDGKKVVGFMPQQLVTLIQ